MAIDSEHQPAEVEEEEEIPEPVPVVHAEHEPLDEGEESDEYDIEVRVGPFDLREGESRPTIAWVPLGVE